MNRYLFPSIALLFLLVCLPVDAQRTRGGSYAREATAILQKYKRQLSAQANRISEVKTDSDSVVVSPYLYRLIGPGVYYHDVLSKGLKLNGVQSGEEGMKVGTDGMSDYNVQVSRSADEVLLRAYASAPELFRYHEQQIESEKIVSPVSVAAKKEDLSSIYDKVAEIKDVTDVVSDVDVDLHIVRPNFWTTKGKFSLQFTQNYFSENWYRGGNNNVTMLSNLVLEANYNDQRWVQWDNKLDLRLGFVTATSDSVHRYLTNNDKIQLNSKLGVKAAKNWFYTLSAEAKSQFLPGHKANDRRTYSKFLAPLDVYVSLGMDWKPTFKNGNTFSLALLPLSYKMRYICDSEEAIHASYNMRDKSFQQDFGSRIEFNSRLTVVKNLTWRCRYYYFTSYEYAESELENVLSFQFNKYISSEVYTLWRFDDNRDKKYYDDTLGFFQFKEYFTLGLAYNF